jgi:KaiC/GvpD/RAD55 family RecA-like ATPase
LVAQNNKRLTGVLGLDPALEGGFPKGTTILIMGSPLSGVDLMARQFWHAGEDKGIYLMLDGEIEEGMTDARDIPPDQFPSYYTGQRIVIDSLSTIIMKFGVEAALRVLSAAHRESENAGSNIMFILYTGIHRAEEEIQILRMGDVILELRMVTFVTEIERQLAVHRLKGSPVPKRLIPFNITDKGIELSTTSRVV